MYLKNNAPYEEILRDEACWTFFPEGVKNAHVAFFDGFYWVKWILFNISIKTAQRIKYLYNKQ